MELVLDNSIVMRWLLSDGSPADQEVAATVLRSIESGDTRLLAPAVWPLEVANVVARAEGQGLVTEADTTRFLRLLEDLMVAVDPGGIDSVFGNTLQLARRFGLSAYDASYLALALQHSATLATLDQALVAAARRAGVPVFLSST
ncbi:MULTISPECIES: type II toxin-antitoxin system VapC family toxin [unclassified Thioalkalivibrio]|uniref:type II toxin-antitoxin system VapC family toxin n=1 Tax=unclassified Thioalkalivibrio TaxID=2621013 RepID=UPI00036918B2|nr:MULTISPECIES: type II toxin-antitoxin system VapC family toxin [unclassified Thioalkalivibrio]